MTQNRAATWQRHAATSAFGLLLGATLLTWLWTRYPAPEPTRLLVSPPASQNAVAASRCPPRTLEDHGVCIPVPVTQEQESNAELVPLLPGRPTELDAYHLPVPGRAELVNSSVAEVAPRFRLEGQALAISVANPVPLASSDLLGLESATVLGSDRAAGWLMLYLQNPTPTLVLLSGLVELQNGLSTGNPIPTTTTLAKTARVFFMLARQLPASPGKPSVDDFRPGASVPTDIRNLLRIKGAAAP